MNKDYVPSAIFEQEDLERFEIPTYFQDSCVDHYVRLKACVFSTSTLHQSWPLNSLFKSGSCRHQYRQWDRCQKQRERDIEAKTSLMLRQQIAAQSSGGKV